MSVRLFDEAEHVDLYQKFRPKWTKEFAEKVVTFLKEKKTSPLLHAVDLGCGSGQSTAILAPHFQQVLGIDVSEAQISKASAANTHHNVEYRVGQAECIPAADRSVDLLTCLTSAHWFDFEKFHAEVDRVLVPGGCLAVAGLVGNTFTDDTLTSIAKQFIYHGPMEDCYGSNEKFQYFLNAYRDLPMPYDGPIRDDSMSIQVDLTLPEYIGLVSTYSPYREFCRRYPEDKGALLQNLQKRLYEATKSTKSPEEVILHAVYPIFLLISRKPQQ